MELPIRLDSYPLAATLKQKMDMFLFIFAMLLVGSLVFVRRPDDPAARAVFLTGSLMTHATAWTMGLNVGDLVGGVGFWLYSALIYSGYLLTGGAALHFALVFPRPHPITLRRPWLITAAYLAPQACLAAYITVTRHRASNTLDWLGTWIGGTWLISGVYMALIIGLLAWSYRARHDAITRQKIRLVVFTVSICCLASLALWFVPGVILGEPIVRPSVVGLLFLPVPVAMAIAILRHRLFDIDVIINRTLVYGVLTASLALLYWGSVVALQQFFRALTGQSSDLAIIVSTLAIAALFQPLRRRIQASIDRRFYRRKYDAAKVLASFAVTVRDEVELDRLTGRLVEVVEETMQPTQVSVWLRKREQLPR